MKVTKINVTPKAEEHIAYCARVSSNREDKTEDIEKLLSYCIRNGHWSIFESSYLTLEIETSLAISRQILRHKSFTFQEFSQRYQDVNRLGVMFENVELRRKAVTNRQSSIEDITLMNTIVEVPTLTGNKTMIPAIEAVRYLLKLSSDLYTELLTEGVAPESARNILPQCTKTKLYVTGNVRSWIHFLQVREDEHSQKEIREVAKKCRQIFNVEFPVISQILTETSSSVNNLDKEDLPKPIRNNKVNKKKYTKLTDIDKFHIRKDFLRKEYTGMSVNKIAYFLASKYKCSHSTIIRAYNDW